MLTVTSELIRQTRSSLALADGRVAPYTDKMTTAWLLIGLLGRAWAASTATELFESARTASPADAILLLQRAATLGLVEAQAMLGLAHAQGHGGLAADASEAMRWFRMAAIQGDDDSAYNLVALCEARPRCIGAGTAETRRWLSLAAAQQHAAACFELGNLVFEEDAAAALDLFLRASRAGHAAASYNAAHVLALGRAGAVEPDLTAALLLFFRAELAAAGTKVAEDARAALDELIPRWVAAAESDASVEETSLRFEAARGEGDGDGGAADGLGGPAGQAAVEARCVGAWREGAAEWSRFERLYAAHASYENGAALAALHGALRVFESMLAGEICAAELGSAGGTGRGTGPGSAGPVGGGGSDKGVAVGSVLGPMRSYLLLSKLTEGWLALARDDAALRPAATWHEALAAHPLCAAAFAAVEEDRSCFNDRLAAAVTLRRRAAAAGRERGGEEGRASAATDDAAAETLVELGRAHGRAATRWARSAQTPRVFWPELSSVAWWDASRFPVSTALRAAWASGAIAEDLERLGVRTAHSSDRTAVAVGASGGAQAAATAGGADPFERIVSSGAPIRGRPGDDASAAGIWSEYMLFDGREWVGERCAVARSLCALLRATAEVAGNVTTADGRTVAPQGQVTLFRLRPGAHVLPHVGVSNQRLVLQFPLAGWEGVRFRVGDEWRGYEEGEPMVFDDSYEHEVKHDGAAPRLVLYAVLHHPDLGTPALAPA